MYSSSSHSHYYESCMSTSYLWIALVQAVSTGSCSFIQLVFKQTTKWPAASCDVDIYIIIVACVSVMSSYRPVRRNSYSCSCQCEYSLTQKLILMLLSVWIQPNYKLHIMHARVNICFVRQLPLLQGDGCHRVVVNVRHHVHSVGIHSRQL